MSKPAALHNATMVVIPEPATPIELHLRWRQFPTDCHSAEKQEQQNIAKAIPEIVAIFFDSNGIEIETRILHRKLLHLETGAVVEGFFIAYDETFITVTTNAFSAMLEKASVYIKEPGTTHYEQVIRWWIKPTVFNENQGGRSEC